MTGIAYSNITMCEIWRGSWNYKTLSGRSVMRIGKVGQSCLQYVALVDNKCRWIATRNCTTGSGISEGLHDGGLCVLHLHPDHVFVMGFPPIFDYLYAHNSFTMAKSITSGDCHYVLDQIVAWRQKVKFSHNDGHDHVVYIINSIQQDASEGVNRGALTVITAAETYSRLQKAGAFTTVTVAGVHVTGPLLDSITQVPPLIVYFTCSPCR